MVTVAIIGLGSRGKDTYAKCQSVFQDRMKIVAAADIIPEKLDDVRREYSLEPQMCFSSAEELMEQDRLAGRSIYLHTGPPALRSCHESHGKGI